MEPKHETARPSLAALAWVFMSIGMQSFGGGMSAWIWREVVLSRRWLTEGQFVGGMALSQITPGANGVNLAVFVGTTLRGPAGALAALAGMLLVPVIAVLVLGAAFTEVRDVPGIGSAMAGLGAAAIGMTAANGLRMSRNNIRDIPGGLVMATTAAAVGIGGLPLLPVLLAMLPVSLLLAWRR
ncbi:chromate transporter [Limobrevibacterium gyesilva]|uniref:Chromate transporter n=1 Tax=Limobrevibacterium gyesilva TaxID=2991712 RepID=A0AA41YNE1_9PROT|nr:chromate transporter [Limobrevibacterium gyesilva]MCW3473515.1 chromate transporter [Limobrevibacterium gyesilva]